MTGYGRGADAGEGLRVSVEVRSVNHRFLEVVVRTPRLVAALEDRLRRLVAARLARGRVEVSVSCEDTAGRSRRVRVDTALARGYADALRTLARDLELGGGPDLGLVAGLPEVLTVTEEAVDAEGWWPVLERAAGRALDALVAMRSREGEALKQHLRGRLEALGGHLEAIAARAPEVVEEYRRRLWERVGELVGWRPGHPPQLDPAGPSGEAAEPANAPRVTLDEARLATEVALFADRASIDEELVRARSHLEQLLAALEAGEPVGRRMDFLVQELGRELTTMGAKASDARIAAAVVAARTELEKVREQVQNVE